MLAGAKVLDTQVHQHDRRIDDDNQNRCIGAGHTIGALFCEFVDSAGNEQITRRDQQNDRADCGDVCDTEISLVAFTKKEITAMLRKADWLAASYIAILEDIEKGDIKLA